MSGRLSFQLLEFYKWCKQGKNAIFTMPEGNIYSEKAHQEDLKIELKKQKAEIKKMVEGMKREPRIYRVPCPDGMEGCLVIHYSNDTRITPEERDYNLALKEIIKKIDTL